MCFGSASEPSDGASEDIQVLDKRRIAVFPIYLKFIYIFATYIARNYLCEAGSFFAMTVIAPEVSTDKRNKIPIIDCDVHPTLPNNFESISPYLSENWSKWFRLKKYEMKRTRGGSRISKTIREDARTPDGNVGGSSQDHMVVDLLEKEGIDTCVLVSNELSGMALSGGVTTEESIQLVSAGNDYFINEWLSRDERFKYALVVPVRDPYAAVKEIRRLGNSKGVVAVNLALLPIGMGYRYYYPIYEEAARQDLPVYVHILTEIGGPNIAGNTSHFYESFTELHATFPTIAYANVASLIFNGTFERFPDLKVVFAEFGIEWVLTCLWRMDTEWKGLREEAPWVRRAPSEYMRDHVRITTQPLPEVKQKWLAQYFEMAGDDLFLFSSDYPHWDNDMPKTSLSTLTEESRRKIFHENAESFFRLKR